MTYTPPATQEDLDRLIADRLSRQEAKIRGEFAGFDDLKAKADKFDASEAANKTELQKLIDRAEAAEKKAAEFEAEKKAAADKAAHDKQVAEWADEVAKATNVPAALLRGSTKEDLEKHAEQIKPVIVATRNGVVPNEGAQPSNATTEERATVAALFGSK